MKLKLSIDFTTIIAYASIPTNPDLQIDISSIIEAENCDYVAGEEFNRLILVIEPSNSYLDLAIYADNDVVDYVFGNPTDFYDNLGRILEDEDTPLIITGDVNENYKANLVTMLALKMVNIDIDGYTGIILYRQNSANNVVSKSLNLISVIQGRFNIPIGLKSFYLDIEGTIADFEAFNYIHIPKFERYYYVSSVQLVTDKLVRYNFSEDVLMTWQALIRSQNAFVTRQAVGSEYLFDNRYPLENIYSEDNLVGYLKDTANNNLTNCVLKFDIIRGSNDDCNFLVSTKLPRDTNNPSSYPMVTISEDIVSPDNNLPKIASHVAPQTINYFISQDSVNALINACMNDDITASYVNNIMWLPFVPTDLFPLANRSFMEMYIGDKHLDAQYYRFEPLSQTIQQANLPIGFYSYEKNSTEYRIDNFPYIIIKDFKVIPIYNDWRDYEPYSNYEIWIPFCQWVKVNAIDIFATVGVSDRLLIYYSLDVSSGQATAYLYNYDRKFVIWSGACQMGVKLDITLTNINENIKQKQSNALNMGIGLVSSAVSIGVGVASENPVAIAGGVLSAGKTLANTVNSNRMLLDRSQTAFGTNEGQVFAINYVDCRITTYKSLLTNDQETIYYAMNGKPYNKYDSLSGLSGYTEIGDIQFNPSNYAISQDEINEIVALLRNGVIL